MSPLEHYQELRLSGNGNISRHGRFGRSVRLTKRGVYIPRDASTLDHNHPKLVRSRVGARRCSIPCHPLNAISARTLTDIRIADPESLRSAIKKLHKEYGVPNVVVSSIPMKPWLAEFLPGKIPKSHPTDLLCISSSSGDAEKRPVVHACTVPLISGYFSGVGDLFSALVLAHFDPDRNSPLSDAVGKALTKTHAIIELTDAYSQTLEEADRTGTDDELDEKDPMRLVRRMRGRELRLIQGQDIIRGEGLRREMKAWETFWENH